LTKFARQLSKRASADAVSCAWQLLAEAQLQPHKSRYWLNTKETDPEVFHEQVRTVCDCYLQAPKLLVQFDAHTVCIDEMTGIQAQERIAHKKDATRAACAAFIQAAARI